MKKGTLRFILALSILMFIIGLIPLFPEFFRLCESRYELSGCFWSSGFVFYLAYLTILAPLIFIIFGVLLLRLKSLEVFQSWKKFAKVYLLISLPYLSLSFLFPSNSGGILSGVNPFGGAFMFTFLSILFFLISLILIVYKSLKLRSERNQII